VAAADGDTSGAILLGNGDGTLAAPTLYPVSAGTIGTALGDLDGDGDLDWVISSYTTQQWHVLVNDGSGTFTPETDIPAESNAYPSCAIILDVDGDGDLDLALTDETSDRIRILRNDGGPTPDCPAVPDTCRTPIASGASSLKLKKGSTPAQNKMTWTGNKGAA